MKKQFEISKENGKVTISAYSANKVFANWKWDDQSSYTMIDSTVNPDIYPSLSEAKEAFDNLNLPSEQIMQDGSFGGKANDEFKELIKYQITIDEEDFEGCSEYELTEDVEEGLFGNSSQII